MSLKELRALAEEDDTATTKADEPETQDELEADEVEADEGSSEEEGAEAEDEGESDDFELELDGESEPDRQKPSAEEALIHKLTKERKKRQQASTEVDELKAQIADMQKAMSTGQSQPQRQQQAPEAQYPRVPLLYENGVDTAEQYGTAYQKWVNECRRIDESNNQRVQQNDEYAKSMRSKTEGLAKRAAQFATDNRVSVDRVADALNRATDEVDGATNIEGSLAYLLDSVGDGGERVAYYIGTNENAMTQIKQLLTDDPNGFKAIAHMTRLAEKLKPKHSKRISKAPAPDESLRGDGSPASSRKLQDAFDKASNTSDLKAMRDIQKQADARGVKLT